MDLASRPDGPNQALGRRHHRAVRRRPRSGLFLAAILDLINRPPVGHRPGCGASPGAFSGWSADLAACSTLTAADGGQPTTHRHQPYEQRQASRSGYGGDI